MSGKSDREKASEGLFSQISGFDPSVRNRFDQPGVLPFSPGSLVPAFERATASGVRDLRRTTERNVKTAQKSTTAGLQSRGATGSVLEDAIAKSRAQASGQGTNAIQKFLTSRQGQLPGVMNQANLTGLQLAGGQQSADFQNILNMFQKFGLTGGAIGGLSDDTLLDDIFSILNTAGTVAGGAAAISDIRYKENIVSVGLSPSGIMIFQFNYINDPKHKLYVGVIADNIEDEYPDAVVRSYCGVKHVIYSKIDVEFKEV